MRQSQREIHRKLNAEGATIKPPPSVVQDPKLESTILRTKLNAIVSCTYLDLSISPRDRKSVV